MHDTARKPPRTLLLGALVTLASFATDMGLPVLAATAASLNVEPATAALTMSVFMAGFALGPLIMAPISDRLGRRRFLLGGCATFAVFGVLGAFASSLSALLLWRFIMGAGAGTVQVLVVASIRDYFSGREARIRQSYVSLVGGVAPIIAPTVGVWIAQLGGWRAIYGALAGGGFVLFLLVLSQMRESVVRRNESLLTARAVVQNYWRVIQHPVSFGYAVVVSLCFGCLFAYVSGSSLVLIGVMGISEKLYGVLFAATSFGLLTGSLLNAQLNRNGISHHTLIAVGLGVIVVATLILLALSFTGVLTASFLIALIVISHVGHAIVRANGVQGALEPVPDIAGVASAVTTGLQMVIGASTSAIAAMLFDGKTANAMTGTMTVCAVGAMLTYVLVVRPADQKRIHTSEHIRVVADEDVIDLSVEVG